MLKQPYLRRIIKKYVAQEPVEEVESKHAFHCISRLREEIMCTASDALLRIDFENRTESEPALRFGQRRWCKRWGPLRDWAVSDLMEFVMTLLKARPM